MARRRRHASDWWSTTVVLTVTFVLCASATCDTSRLDLTETLRQLTSSNDQANDVAERLENHFNSSDTECIVVADQDTLMQILAGFDRVMTRHHVPRFRTMAKSLSRALALKGRLKDSAAVFNASFHIERGLHRDFTAVDHSLFGYVSFGKLIHDMEHHQHLKKKDVALPRGIELAYNHTFEALSEYLDIEGKKDDDDKMRALLNVSQPGFKLIQPFYNRALHQPDLPSIHTFLNRDVLKFDQADARFTLSEHGIVVIDDVFDDKVHKIIYEYMMSSTTFFQKTTNTFSLKADFPDALAYKLAAELKERLPQTLEKYLLQKAWSYKINNNHPKQKGLGVHADEALINCNIWLTPSDANLDKDSGGLVIYKMHAYDDLRFNDWYDDVRDDKLKYKKLKSIEFKNVTVTYRSNRGICFRSSLYHATDKVHFKKGFQNRRIGITLLFGESFAK